MRFLKANKIFNGKFFLPDNSVLVLNEQNNLIEILPESKVSNQTVEFFEGIITPGFVNAHCHLELSYLANKIPVKTGLVNFIINIFKQRQQEYKKEQIIESAFNADLEMWQNGIVVVGDISNNEDSFKIKQNSKIKYHTFVEVIGLNPNNKSKIFDNALLLSNQLREFKLSGSIVPHAPYSTSLDLIQLIANYNRENNLPLSIHNQETEEEKKFFYGIQNDFKKLYEFLKVDISFFKAPNCSSLSAYLPYINNQKAILVHNTFSEQADIHEAAAKNCFFCLCPNANLFIENKLPDYSIFKSYTNNLCLGTDSLASNYKLDLISEANLILKHTHTFSLENMLQMLTFNGALALNLHDSFGQLLINKNTGLNLISFIDSEIKLIKKII